jgi:hypothetical protein
MNKKFPNSLELQKENIATDNNYYSCSISQNQTFHSSHILDMAIKNLHKKDNKNMYSTRKKSSTH